MAKQPFVYVRVLTIDAEKCMYIDGHILLLHTSRAGIIFSITRERERLLWYRANTYIYSREKQSISSGECVYRKMNINMFPQTEKRLAAAMLTHTRIIC